MNEYIEINDDADFTRHLGRRMPERRNLSLYDQARELLERADAIHAVVIEHTEPPAETDPEKLNSAQRAYWTDYRRRCWVTDDEVARAEACEVVRFDKGGAIAKATALATLAHAAGDTRAHAKAAAARIELTDAVFRQAYGRAMPKKWRLK